MIEKITLITMGQGNPIALKRTLESFKGIVSEVVFGDVCIFEDDRKLIKTYCKEFNMRMIPLPFDYIYKFGFSSILNLLIKWANNNYVIYMNVGEIIDVGAENILNTLNNNLSCNAFYFDHSVETHRWFRMFDKRDIEWSGIIHEEPVEISGHNMRPYHRPIFTMADTDKDMIDPFKAAVANTTKEICYFNQYLKLVDDTENSGATNHGWIEFARDNYESMKFRLDKKGESYKAFVEGDFDMFLHDIYNNAEFEQERFSSNHMIEFQGDPKYLGK